MNVVKTNELSKSDLEVIKDFWRRTRGASEWVGEDIYMGLIERFVGTLNIADHNHLDKFTGKPVLYLANHQTTVESILFTHVLGGLTGTLVSAIAKAEHKNTWLGMLYDYYKTFPEINLENVLLFFDRSNPAEFKNLLIEMMELMEIGNRSILIHIEGTRSMSNQQVTKKLSRSIVQLAISTNTPIIPVKFTGGLPVSNETKRFEYPVAYGSQDIYIGNAIYPTEIRNLPFHEQKKIILDGINNLGVEEKPVGKNNDCNVFAKEVEELSRKLGMPTEYAVIYNVLEKMNNLSESTKLFLELVKKPHALRKYGDIFPNFFAQFQK